MAASQLSKMYKEGVNDGARSIPQDNCLLFGSRKIKSKLRSVSQEQKAAGDVLERFL
jgi:hypothetical protein